jgi:hypothetical protein
MSIYEMDFRIINDIVNMRLNPFVIHDSYYRDLLYAYKCDRSFIYIISNLLKHIVKYFCTSKKNVQGSLNVIN